MASRIPASSVAGSEGEVGEQLEEVKSYLGVGRIGVGDGRRGRVVEEGGRRWWMMAASQRRRGRFNRDRARPSSGWGGGGAG